MLTNTYAPFVGGVPRSVAAFTEQYRARGHRVIIVAPEFEGRPETEDDVIRIPSLQRFSHTDFSVRLPIPAYLEHELRGVAPDIVHSHHPFLLGDTALRVANRHQVPLVFTHHTLYEQYIHYLPFQSAGVETAAVELATEYANLCDAIFAPSGSIAELLRKRGVVKPVHVLPTGIDQKKLAAGDGGEFRRAHGIPGDAFVLGHLGRIAREKNLPFLARIARDYLVENPAAWFLLVGHGPIEEEIVAMFDADGIRERFRAVGILEGKPLSDAWYAMDIFLFASHSETQGMVIAEAMASGIPVIAVDATGTRDVVEHERNGWLIPEDNEALFLHTLRKYALLTPHARAYYGEGARKTAARLTIETCANCALRIYESLRAEYRREHIRDESLWARALRRIETEWDILKKYVHATETLLENR